MAAWVDDEIHTLTDGWIPLFSERRPDGTLRVVYGQLPDGGHQDCKHLMAPPNDGGSRAEASWSAIAVLAVALLLIAFAIFARAA